MSTGRSNNTDFDVIWDGKRQPAWCSSGCLYSSHSNLQHLIARTFFVWPTSTDRRLGPFHRSISDVVTRDGSISDPVKSVLARIGHRGSVVVRLRCEHWPWIVDVGRARTRLFCRGRSSGKPVHLRKEEIFSTPTPRAHRPFITFWSFSCVMFSLSFLPHPWILCTNQSPICSPPHPTPTPTPPPPKKKSSDRSLTIYNYLTFSFMLYFSISSLICSINPSH